MMTINDFIHKYKLKNKATQNIKIQQVLASLGLNDVEIYLRDGPFSSGIGIVHLHPSKGTHWVAHTNENFFDSYACTPPQNLSKFNIKQNGDCFCSEYKIQDQTRKK